MINKSMIYQSILELSGKKKMLALLIDPEETGVEKVPRLLKHACDAGVSFILVGGSLVNHPIDAFVNNIREHSSLPVILFPGNPNQLTGNADGLLLLSLISGRNPEFLIGNHVVAAQFLRRSSLEIIPTGYMLIENGNASSAEYISNTKPLPRNKSEIAISTAIAGELLGLKLIYIEGGSGACGIVPPGLISAVKENISIPLIVGGGIRTSEELLKVFDAGADIAVIGNAIEHNPELLEEFSKVLK
ncbi:MAG: geranylgeranylglyceryl/heptaprenylglyceryl phosphate synthase [Bacteroidales bacterium]